MSDYFTLLASRALGLMPVVRPRLPGRFEPVHPVYLPVYVSGDGMLEALDEAGHAPGTAAQAQVTDGQRPPARAARPETLAPGAAGEPPPAGPERSTGPAQGSATPAPRPEQMAASRHSRRPVTGRVGRHHAPAAPAAEEAGPWPGAGAAPLLEGADEAERPAAPPRPALHPEAAPPREPAQLLAAPVLQVAAPGSTPDSPMLREAVEPAAGPATDAVPPVLQAAGPPPPRWRRPLPSPQPAGDMERKETALPAPAVRVTIGRIEVRAAPAEHAVAPAPRRPALSLSEYLRDRDGAGP